MFSRRPTSAAMVVTILRFLVLLIAKSVCVGHGHGDPHHVTNVTSVMHMCICLMDKDVLPIPAMSWHQH